MHYMSLRDVIEQITQLMNAEAVSLEQFERADIGMRWKIVYAFGRRTGKLMRPVRHAGYPEFDSQDYLQEKMRTFVTRDADPGWTKLKVMDLLGKKVMFAGLYNVGQADDWMLVTET